MHDRRARRIEWRHGQRRAQPEAARITLHERLLVRIEQRASRVGKHRRIARLRDRGGDVVERLARLNRNGVRRLPGRRRFLTGARRPDGRGGRAQGQDGDRAANSM
ncbi:hypothetical protein [Burkholderia sp. lig30]|uniref:hypothetical protein n=1 Tax=Burkholderia sp. lig30 TaxID=1192124 RepID=UPI001F239318|nr:hypothetical protein [Burkholderia sp. lig30]